jgi:hypothetical protein
VAKALLKFALPAGNVTEQLVNARFVRQSPSRDFQLGQGCGIVEISRREVVGPGQVRFAGIGPEACRRLERGLGLGEALRRAIDGKEINAVVGGG